jgi:hypothetical protein
MVVGDQVVAKGDKRVDYVFLVNCAEPARARDVAVWLASGAGANALALVKGSHFLYALAGGAREIDAFRLNVDGSLTPLGAAGGLPAGSVGLAAS